MHIHLDAIGGISGNMFVAALLELCPEHAPILAHQLARAGFADMVSVAATPKHDGVLQGTYFSVTPKAQTKASAKAFKGHAASHAHTRWSEISSLITASDLDEKVKIHALGIFTILAEAEAGLDAAALRIEREPHLFGPTPVRCPDRTVGVNDLVGEELVGSAERRDGRYHEIPQGIKVPRHPALSALRRDNNRDSSGSRRAWDRRCVPR